MVSKSSAPAIRRDWVSKTLAGALLGLTFALGSSGLLLLALQDAAPGARAQLAMWLVPPVWLGILSGSFLFRSGPRAWWWLGAANLAVFGALALTRLS